MSKQNLFNTIQIDAPNYNMFDLSHEHKTTMNDGWLVPVMCEEALPGDTWFIGSQALVRMAPMLAPVMHRFGFTVHYFYVPNRIVWEPFLEWVFGDDTVGIAPRISIWDSMPDEAKRLPNYLGIPYVETVNYADMEVVSALPFAAYQCIYNEYYRDQNLIAEVPYKLIAGDNNANLELYKLRRRSWEHDYFTSALPFAQRGNPVSLPLIQDFRDVEVKYNKDLMSGFENLTGSPDTVPVPAEVTNMTYPPGIGIGRLYADTSSLEITATTITDLRRAFALQRWEEKNARGGVRPIESLKIHFGITSDDARLQRPEYITGIEQPIVISEVLNTTGTTDAPQGNMAGHGVMLMQGNYGKCFTKEHGYIMAIASVRPRTAYMQGIARHFKKYQDRFHYYFRDFAHIGEQAVWNSEIYAFQDTEEQNKTFGYVPRYAEYKFANNRISGEFTTNLDYWHAARIFGNAPALNQDFIECQSDNRIFAVIEGVVDHYYAQILHTLKVRRQMPYFGNPM